MWKLWQTAQQTHSRPSELVCIQDKLSALLLDNAVTYFGTVIENALQERIEMGKGRWEPKYTLSDLLDSDFVLPQSAPKRRILRGNKGAPGIAQVLALSEQGVAGIKRWVYDPKLAEEQNAV